MPGRDQDADKIHCLGLAIKSESLMNIDMVKSSYGIGELHNLVM
jgi:hypothetical protein